MSRVDPAPLPRTPKKTISTITKQIAALTRSAHWMPNTFAAAYIFFAPPIAAQRRDVNVSIRITSTGAPIAPAI